MSNSNRIISTIACAVAVVVAALVGCSRPIHLLDLDGQYVDPFRLEDVTATVFLFTRRDCPNSNRYAPEVRRLCNKFGKQGVVLYLVYLDPDASSTAIRDHLREYDYPYKALRDPELALVALTGVSVTPEAAVFTPDRQIVYLGRIDDRFPQLGCRT